MNNGVDLRKLPIENHVRERVARRVQPTLDNLSVQIDNNHIFGAEFFIWHARRLDDKKPLVAIQP